MNDRVQPAVATSSIPTDFSPRGEAILEVAGLTRYFDVSTGAFGRESHQVKAVDGVSFAIRPSSTLALVGESGCGKTTTARMIVLLERMSGGRILFQGQDMSHPTKSLLREYRRSVQAVFQDPFSSLSPRMRVRDIIGEPIEIHERATRRNVAGRVAALLEQVGLDPAKASLYPHQFSGGQRQRIAIARALALQPRVIVLDEPVSALDVSIRAQILNLLVALQQEHGLSYLLISHDLAIVEHMSHDVAVMYAGKIVERGTGAAIYDTPAHPYTQALLGSVPSLDPDVPVSVVTGEVANPAALPPGCRFHPRCQLRQALGTPEQCEQIEPELLVVGPNHSSACHFANSSDGRLLDGEALTGPTTRDVMPDDQDTRRIPRSDEP